MTHIMTVQEIMSNPAVMLLTPESGNSSLKSYFPGASGQTLSGVYVTLFDGILSPGRKYLDSAGRVRRCRQEAGAPFLEGVGIPADVLDIGDLVARVEAVAYNEV